MSEALVCYLLNSLLRGAVIVLPLLIWETLRRRKLVFSGCRPLYCLALLLILLPLERINFGSALPRQAAAPVEMPDWQFTPTATAVPVVAPVATTPAPVAAAAPAARTSRPWTVCDLFAVLYLSVVLALSAKQIRHYLIWRNRIGRCVAITSGRVYEAFRESKHLTGLEAYPIRLLDGGDTLPAAACFGTLRHGAVICPLAECVKYSAVELRMILIHELEHLRRFDNPVAFFLIALTRVFFLNPFLRPLCSRWALAAELDCDRRVRSTLQLDRPGLAQYAALLLDHQTRGSAWTPVSGLGATARNLKQRIQEFSMSRNKLQLASYLAGIAGLLLLGSWLSPRLIAAPDRTPLPPAVTKNLPSTASGLSCFNAEKLDAKGAELIEKSLLATGNGDMGIYRLLSLMQSAVKNKGSFYLAQGPGFGSYLLIRNGLNQDELILDPTISISGTKTVAKKLEDGYFSLFSVEKKLPAMGLGEILQKETATTPDELLVVFDGKGNRTVVAKSGDEYRLRRNGVTTEEISAALIVEQATAYLPEKERAAKQELLRKILKYDGKTADGKTSYAIEFPLTPESITLFSDLLKRRHEIGAAKYAPKVVALDPPNSATGVDPDLKEIKVTFDRPMSARSWSFCQRGDDFPETTGNPSYDDKRITITMPVRLRPDMTYNIYLNSPPYLGFCSEQGYVLESVHYSFSTAKGGKTTPR